MTVIVPADCKECEEAIKFAAENQGPMYIRIARSNVCDVFDDKYEFDFSNANLLEDGTDVSVITNGETLAEVIMAAHILKEEGYSVQVINSPVVKPLDGATIIDNVKKTKFVITVENHSIIGGLGSAVCELLAEYYPTPVHRIGVNDEFGQSGKASELMEYYKLDSKSLAVKIRKYIDKYRLVK
jgi:transketolase